jgi:hypothetical protein
MGSNACCAGLVRMTRNGKRALRMDQAIGFDELHWLQELESATQKTRIPEPMRTRLLIRRLIEPKPGGFTLTAKGRIALAKLG